MKKIILSATVLCFSTMAFASVKVCGTLESAPSAGLVYGNDVIYSGDVSYYLDSETNADASKTAQKACVTGELKLVEGTVTPIAQIINIKKISYQK
jgi:hypothetical protein